MMEFSRRGICLCFLCGQPLEEMTEAQTNMAAPSKEMVSFLPFCFEGWVVDARKRVVTGA